MEPTATPELDVVGKKIANLPTVPRDAQVGEAVLYVLPANHPRVGEVRPAVIVRPFPRSGEIQLCNLIYFLDGTNDGVFPGGELVRWAPSSHADQETKAPGTFHYPEA